MCIQGNVFYCVRKKNTEVKAQRIPEVILLITQHAQRSNSVTSALEMSLKVLPSGRRCLGSLLSTAGAVTGSLSYSPRGIPNAHPVWIHHELQSLTSVRPWVRALLAPISCTHKTCTTPLRAHRAAEALTHSQVNVGLAWLLNFETPVHLFCLDDLLT